MSEEEMKLKENFEHEVLDRLSCLCEEDFDKTKLDNSYIVAVLRARNIILDLYNKEKEKNEKLEKGLKFRIKYCQELEKVLIENSRNCVAQKDTFEYFNEEFIRIDKIRDKIKELKQVMEQDEVDDFGIHSIGWGALDYTVEQLQKLLEEE